jgi:hypothetical protein
MGREVFRLPAGPDFSANPFLRPMAWVLNQSDNNIYPYHNTSILHEQILRFSDRILLRSRAEPLNHPQKILSFQFCY